MSNNSIDSREEYFIKYSVDYLRAIQERVATYFYVIDYFDIQTKVDEATELWAKIVKKEAKSFYSIIYENEYKSNDVNFMKRKGYRNKNSFAFDLITNWVFERSIISNIHKYSGLNSSEFLLNPETCDVDACLGWGDDDNKPRKINSQYDFITHIDGEIHNIELKSMFVYNKKSANFKTFFKPKEKEDLSKYHILFFNFNGLGNPKMSNIQNTTFEMYYIPWSKLSDCHIHYPPQLDSKPCYLVHLNGCNSCETFDKTGNKNVGKVIGNNSCFIIDNILIQKELRYCDIKQYLNYNNFNPKDMLDFVKSQ